MVTGQRRGIAAGLLAAALFGASAPVSKLLLPGLGPLLLAALLYLGAGAGLTLYRLLVPSAVDPSREARLLRADALPLAGIIVTGGILGPVLMLAGLSRVSALAGSLLLNLEAPFTMLLAVLLFGEHLGRRASLAAGLVVAGGVVLGWRPGELRADPWGAIAIAGACASWAIDNNLTQRLSLRSPILVVRLKTLGAGICTLVVALATGHRLPGAGAIAAAMLVGSLAYGASIVLDMIALRHLGAAREAAMFATAPFIGAALAVPLVGDRLGLPEIAGGVLMAAGVVLLVRERHEHAHTHVALEHEHAHVHDEHHQHAHAGPVSEPHSHAHRHEPVTHSHPHAPDLHHRHDHE
jgi:drug/metabolite transporter (DMT)-like permease